MKKVIIIGAGTAGLTIAHRLQNNFNVTIIEKSQYKRYPIWYRFPLFIGILFQSKKERYIRKRECTLSNGRRIPFFESNLFGGTSVMNGCVHMLGNKAQWNELLFKFDADYDDILDSYKTLYSLNLRDKGKISLQKAFQSEVASSFTDTLNNKGIPLSDMSLSNKIGCGPIFNTVRKYFRTSVLSILGKKKFKIVMCESVDRLLFDIGSNKVTGVKTSIGERHSDYVILSGGVIGTCKVLLDEQSRNNSVLNRLSVGKSVQDHINLRVNVVANQNIGSLNEIYSSLPKKIILMFRHLSGRGTLIRGTGATTAVHLDLDGDGVVDTRIQMVQFSENGRIGSEGDLFSNNNPGFSLSITTLNPKSKGSIELIEGKIVINPMHLSSASDIKLLQLALKFCMDLLNSEPLNNYILKIEKEDEITNNPEKYIFNNVFSGYHLIGGMSSAVNANFSVKNTKNLYVCDASIFDGYAASNIHSSVVLIADIFAKKFLAKNLM